MELYFLSVKRGDFTPKIKMLVCNGHEINEFFSFCFLCTFNVYQYTFFTSGKTFLIFPEYSDNFRFWKSEVNAQERRNTRASC